MSDKYKPMTGQSAAEYCGMSYPRFKKWVTAGRVRSVPSSPETKRREFLPVHLDEFLQSRAEKATSKTEETETF